MADDVLVYDDDCGFCTWWAEYFETRASLPIVGFSDLDPELRERLPDNYKKCSHLVTDERVYSCGASIEEAFVRTRLGSFFLPLVKVLRRFSVYHAVREWGYRRFANNRIFWGKILSRTPPSRRSNG